MSESDPLAPYRDRPAPPKDSAEVERAARIRLYESGADVLKVLGIVLWIWVALAVVADIAAIIA